MVDVMLLCFVVTALLSAVAVAVATQKKLYELNTN